MQLITRLYVQLSCDDRAQDLVEYALIIGFVSVGAAAVLPGPAQQLSIIWSKMVSLTDKAGNPPA